MGKYMNYLVTWTLRVGIRKDVKDRKPGYIDMYRQQNPTP